jgi:putative protein kinase ArgK-like GTPase of G3E family
MALASGLSPISSVSDLGLGTALSQQVKDQTDEEKKKKALGLSVMQSGAAQMLGLGGMTGVGKV